MAPGEVSAPDLAAWRRLQEGDIALASPFLCPEFARIAAAVRPGVRVALARRGGQAVGVFAFDQRGRIGGPVAGALSDCQAALAAPGRAWDPRALLRATGLAVCDFTFLRADQPGFAPFQRGLHLSHAIDLSRGFDDYLRERREAGQRLPGASSGLPHHVLRRARRLEREAGPVRFALHEPDPDALRRLIEWKRAHYRRTGVPDVFARRWTVELLERVHAAAGTAHFAGVLSTLSVGGRVVAAHFGMRAGAVLHWWFPSYDPAFARHSPGLILLVETCREAAAQGIRLVELGPGDEGYKLLLANRGLPVASGFVSAAPSPAALIRRLRFGVEGAAARMPIGGRFRLWPAKALQRLDTLRGLR